MFVHCYLRLAELGTHTRRNDVVQAYGVSVLSLTWRDVVVKLLAQVTQAPLEVRLRYVGARIAWFFKRQKDVIVEFMDGLEASTVAHDYSALFTQNVSLLHSNANIRDLVFEAYDNAVDKHLIKFTSVFEGTIISTVRNPWCFLRRIPGQEKIMTQGLEDACFPSFEETKARVPQEMENCSKIENSLGEWLNDIPQGSSQVGETVDKIQILILRIFSFIRSEIADQIEPYADSFFKLPMIRRLEEDMSQITLSPADIEQYRRRMTTLKEEVQELEETRKQVKYCVDNVQSFMRRRQRAEV